VVPLAQAPALHPSAASRDYLPLIRRITGGLQVNPPDIAADIGSIQTVGIAIAVAVDKADVGRIKTMTLRCS